MSTIEFMFVGIGIGAILMGVSAIIEALRS